ncbi:succinylglutamate desuccinylase/aspartoacylase family protein [Shewanella sp. JM162201]|uniref:Succinylglutamate desuccinylase/aspartoacylase family protein n=1 Tax=Shewanella jiangmenensis TaxID=2837387 RepID=A0ABS5V2U4_9GAMM|nr:succinylglutamate desuccinylase/aspartoacylase family protein [Shewanella jiangmenensis]MBT1444263.1 succinylglutamate desuccinylase/aspartoacylase family protein [Shewanella jiangmenensis]
MRVEKQEVKVGELAAGQALSLPVYRFHGKGKGPSVYIQANVHGAEVQGNAVIYQLMKLLEHYELLGDISLVPLANPLGINQKSGEFTLGRFDPITGVNWNREYLNHSLDIAAWYAAHSELDDDSLVAAFRTELIAACERKLDNVWGVTTGQWLATSLQAMAHRSDIVLDLHTGPKSCKHLYCPEYEREAAQYFSIPYTLFIPNSFGGAMDEAAFVPWWTLAEVAAAHGRELGVRVSALTLELGSQERIDLADALNDAEGILAYLSYRGVIAEKVLPKPMKRFGCLLKDYRKFHAPKAGMVEYVGKVGQPMKAGDVLVNLLRLDLYGTGEELTALKLPEDGVPILHFASASVHQGTELYKVMTKVFAL